MLGLEPTHVMLRSGRSTHQASDLAVRSSLNLLTNTSPGLSLVPFELHSSFRDKLLGTRVKYVFLYGAVVRGLTKPCTSRARDPALRTHLLHQLPGLLDQQSSRVGHDTRHLHRSPPSTLPHHVSVELINIQREAPKAANEDSATQIRVHSTHESTRASLQTKSHRKGENQGVPERNRRKESLCSQRSFINPPAEGKNESLKLTTLFKFVPCQLLTRL